METANKKILLVEDDQNFGAILKDYLMLNDFDVVLAKNGMEGFEKFKKDTYDLCILDVMMPYKDGYTLAKEIREKNKEVPIIFLTAKSMKEDVLKGYKVGADDYLNKPFDSAQGIWTPEPDDADHPIEVLGRSWHYKNSKDLRPTLF
jgi:DNA-binding response OmpR family regulator